MAEHSDDEDSDLDVRISQKLRDRHVAKPGDDFSDSDEDELPMAQQASLAPGLSGDGDALSKRSAPLKPAQAAFSIAPPPANGGIRHGSTSPFASTLDPIGAAHASITSASSNRNPSRLNHDLASVYTSHALEEDRPIKKRPKRYFFVSSAGPQDKLERERQGAQAALAASRRAADFFTALGSPLYPHQSSSRSFDLVPQPSAERSFSPRANGPNSRSAESRLNGRPRSNVPLWDGEPIVSDAEP